MIYENKNTDNFGIEIPITVRLNALEGLRNRLELSEKKSIYLK